MQQVDDATNMSRGHFCAISFIKRDLVHILFFVLARLGPLTFYPQIRKGCKELQLTWLKWTQVKRYPFKMFNLNCIFDTELLTSHGSGKYSIWKFLILSWTQKHSSFPDQVDFCWYKIWTEVKTQDNLKGFLSLENLSAF